jgi:hypothetical protein
VPVNTERRLALVSAARSNKAHLRMLSRVNGYFVDGELLFEDAQLFEALR